MSPFPSPSPSPSPSPFTQSPCTPSPSPRRRYPLVQGHVGPISCAMGTSPGRSSGWRFSQHCPLRSPHAASPQCTHASQRGLARHNSQHRPGASTRLDGSAPHPPGTTSPASSRWASPRQDVVASTGRDLGEGGGGGGGIRVAASRDLRADRRNDGRRARATPSTGSSSYPRLIASREAPRIARVHIAARQRHLDMSPPRAGADARAACDVRHRLLRVGTREFKRVAEEISRVGTPS